MRIEQKRKSLKFSSWPIVVASILTVIAVTGCGRDMSDLDSYMQDVRKRPAPDIDPIPPFVQLETYRYSAAGLRSPFEKPEAIRQIDVTGEGGADVVVKPDFSRQKEPLETFNISSMMMVGTVVKDGTMWGLVDDGESQVHRVQVGQYLGRNHGKIFYIDNSRIDIKEIIPKSGTDGWVERPKTLKLQEQVEE